MTASKKQLLEQAADLFDDGRGKRPEEAATDKLRGRMDATRAP